MTRTHGSFVAPDHVLRTFSDAEASSLADAWLTAFGKRRQGVNTNAYLWHVFSALSYPSDSGAQALACYRQQLGTQFVVLSNDRKLAFLTDLLPEALSWADFYVFPENLAWTMAFTHEDGYLGPYFARHADFAKLDGENRAALAKQQQTQAARRNGWV